MDKIRIKKIIQGKHKLQDGTYAIGLMTKYGVVGVSRKTFPRFLDQNPHLKQFISYRGINVEDLIGRYIYVKYKAVERYYCGCRMYAPQLW